MQAIKKIDEIQSVTATAQAGMAFALPDGA
jgi:hypothetical protein